MLSIRKSGFVFSDILSSEETSEVQVSVRYYYLQIYVYVVLLTKYYKYKI